MKTLHVMRHAKSSWDNPDLNDHDRPLNRRGKNDAIRMGLWLAQQQTVPELILCSTAKRARKTAKRLGRAFSLRPSRIDIAELYHGQPTDYLWAIEQVDQSVNHLLVIGHNPGLEELLLEFTDQHIVLPTAAIVQLRSECEHWLEFRAACLKEDVHVCRPRELAQAEPELGAS